MTVNSAINPAGYIELLLTSGSLSLRPEAAGTIGPEYLSADDIHFASHQLLSAAGASRVAPFLERGREDAGLPAGRYTGIPGGVAVSSLCAVANAALEQRCGELPAYTFLQAGLDRAPHPSVLEDVRMQRKLPSGYIALYVNGVDEADTRLLSRMSADLSGIAQREVPAVALTSGTAVVQYLQAHPDLFSQLHWNTRP